MALKRKGEVSGKSEDKLRRSSRLEEAEKKRRVVGEKDFAEGGIAPKIEVKTEVDVVEDGGPADMSDDDEASMNSSEEADLENERLQYEEERNRMLEENRKRMQELGLADLTQHLSSTYRTQAHLKSAVASGKKRLHIKRQVDLGFQPRRSARQASRPEGGKVPTYRDLFVVKAEQREDVPPRKNSRPPRTSTVLRQSLSMPEVYTEDHAKLLGSYENEWQLLCDGYEPGGGKRIYDCVNGKTCHQCRQKTLGRRTWCSLCVARSGQFCGDCLFMRYGENVLEANANPNWVCPVCRGICNCSFCRIKRGWAPTGNMYRHVLAEGFPSVAHYLIMTRRRQPAYKGEKANPVGGMSELDLWEENGKKAHQKDIKDSTIQPNTPPPTQRMSRFEAKIEASKMVDAKPVELPKKDALGLEKEVPCRESERFNTAKVEIQQAEQQEEARIASTTNFCRKVKQEECQGLNPDDGQLQTAEIKRKHIEGISDVRSRDCKIGNIQSEDLISEKTRSDAPKDGALVIGSACTLTSACLGFNGFPVPLKEVSPSCSPPLVWVDSMEIKACHEQAVPIQGSEKSAEHVGPEEKPTGRTKSEIIRQRRSLEGTPQVSSPGPLLSSTESVRSRLRRKEVISYKSFL